MDKKTSFPYQGFAADQFNLGKNGDGYPMAPPPSYSAAPNATKPGSAGHNMGGGGGRRALASLPSAFYVKKWILLATIAFNFLGMFIALFYVDVILQMIIYRSEAIGKPLCDADLPCDEEMMSTFRAVAYVSLLVGLAFEGLFFYGVAAQHLCLVTGYTVLSILGALSMLLGCAVNPAKLIDTVIIAVLACVSYSYMKDLRAIRDRRIRLGLDVI